VVTPRQVIDVCNEVFGKHAGTRALHAKGTLVKGTFTATPEAAKLSRAAHMQGDPVDVTVRFSNGAGDPAEPDYAQDVRGMAIKLYVADGARHDIVAQTAPRFPVRTPDGFAQLLKAQQRSPAQAIRMPVFLARNPTALAGLRENLAALKPPASYATRRYYAVHAFKWVDGDGGERFVRYTLVPDGDEENISGKEAKARGADYLADDIVKRVTDGTVRFTLELQVAAEGDDVDDPTSNWPKERERVSAGTFELTGLDETREKGDDVLVFDPTHVVDGIELSGDQILRFRRPAYAESIERRSGTKLGE
jgi:catalase